MFRSGFKPQLVLKTLWKHPWRSTLQALVYNRWFSHFCMVPSAEDYFSESETSDGFCTVTSNVVSSWDWLLMVPIHLKESAELGRVDPSVIKRDWDKDPAHLGQTRSLFHQYSFSIYAQATCSNALNYIFMLLIFSKQSAESKTPCTGV